MSINTEKSGYVRLNHFIKFNNLLAELLKEEYEKLDKKLKWNDKKKEKKKWPIFEEKNIYDANGKPTNFKLIDLDIWMYRGKKPADEYVSIRDLYDKGKNIQNFVQRYSTIKGAGKINSNYNFVNQIFETKRQLLKRYEGGMKIRGANREIKKPFFLYGIFLLVRPELKIFDVGSDAVKLQKEFWVYDNNGDTPAIPTDSRFIEKEMNSKGWKVSGGRGEVREKVSLVGKDWDFEDKTTGTPFTAFYFSYLDNSPSTFDIKFFFNKKPNFYAERQEYTVIEKGFHDYDENEDNPVYIGYAYTLDSKLHIVLESEVGTDKFKIILRPGDKPNTLSALKGAMMGVSAIQDRNPVICYEVFLIKKFEFQGKEKNNIELGIRRYLFLHRYVFRIKEDPVRYYSLNVKKLDVNIFKYFIGFWRVWRFNDDNNEIITSLLHVEEDYKAYCYTNQYGETLYDRQACHIDITSNNEICLVTAPMEGSKVVSTILLKKPAHNQTILTGAMNTFGSGPSSPKMRAVAMVKEDEEWKDYFNEEGDIKPEKKENFKSNLKNYNEQDLMVELSGTNENSKTLYESLLDYHQKNTPPLWFFNRSSPTEDIS